MKFSNTWLSGIKNCFFLTAFLAVFILGTVVYRVAVKKRDREPVTILFAGDIMLGRQVGKAMLRAHDPSLPFKEIFPEIRSSDIAIGNLECVFTDTLITGTYLHKSIRFPAYRETVEGLKLAGFDCCSIANNHAMDFGTEGVRSTITTLENNGIIPAGAVSSNPVVIRKKGWMVALFSYWVNRDSLWVVDPENGYVLMDEATVLKGVDEAGKSSDIVVLFLHWGKEYYDTPTDSQRNLAHRLINRGADVIVGHGPHQVQEVEYYGTGLIAYSLGNCVFDQKYEETQKGLLLRVLFDRRKGCPDITLLPVRIRDDTFVTTLLEGREKELTVSTFLSSPGATKKE